MRVIVAAVALFVASTATAAQQVRVLDSFEDLSPWRAQPSDGVSATIHADSGVRDRALRFDVDFHGGAGYAVIHRALPTDLPDDYTISFRVRGTVPPNNIEFKMLDASGDNVWWVNKRDFVFARDWQTVTIRKRHVSFAWGPSGGGDLRHFASLEIAITAGKGGKGSVWFDELTLTPRAATAALATPLVTTDPAIGNARAITDNDTVTSWWPSRPAKSVTLDFGAMREIGGIVVGWERGHHAADYDVDLQGDDSVWTTAYRVRGGNGGDDPIPLPDRDARRLRLRILRPADRNGIAIRDVAIEPLAWSATPNAFAEAVAKTAARGTYPRYLSREQSYWTIVGVSGDRARPLLSEDGTVEPFAGGFSIEPFVHDGSGLLTWADAPSTQSLLDGDLPIPTVHREYGKLALDVTAFVDGAPGRDVGLEADEFLALDLLEPDRFRAREGMLGMADEDHHVLAQRDHLELRIPRGIGDEPEVHDIAENILVDLVGPAVFDMHIHRRVGLEEFLEVGRQIMKADGVDGGDADGAGDDVLDLLQPAVQGIVRLDDLLAVIVQHLAFAREPEFFLAPLDEQAFELAFQRTDLLADGRLRHVVDLGGLGEALRLGQITKHFQAFDLHNLSCPKINRRANGKSNVPAWIKNYSRHRHPEAAPAASLTHDRRSHPDDESPPNLQV